MARLGIIAPSDRLGPISVLPGGGKRTTLVRVSYSGEKPRGMNAESNRGKISYISRDEATGDDVRPFYEDAKGATRIYTAEKGSATVLIDAAKAEEILGDDPVFRIIISPEDKGADLSALASRFMKESFVPAVKGSDVRWIAANHYNTGHPHTHILVSRIDRATGNLLRFPPSYVLSGRVRRDAASLLTGLMGARTPDEDRRIEMERASRYAYTDIDRTIEFRLKADGGVLVLTPEMLSHESKSTQASVRRRLSWMSRMTGRAWFDKERGSWVLKRDWKDMLHIGGAAKMLGMPQEEMRSAVLDGRNTVPYRGTVKRTATVDDEPGRNIFSIIDEKGKTHIITDTIPEDIDARELVGKEVGIGFRKNTDGTMQKKPRVILDGALIREGRRR